MTTYLLPNHTEYLGELPVIDRNVIGCIGISKKERKVNLQLFIVLLSEFYPLSQLTRTSEIHYFYS